MRRFLCVLLLSLCSGYVFGSDRVFREGFEQPCQFLPLPLKSSLVRSYSSYFGVPFGQPHTWIPNYIRNVLIIDPPSIRSIGVHSYSFQGPSINQSGSLRTPSTPFGVVFSITDQCGSFESSSSCTMIESSILQWSTYPNAPDGLCRLTPNKTYYLNVAYFDYRKYLVNSNDIQSTCRAAPNCNSQTCTYECNYHHMASQP